MMCHHRSSRQANVNAQNKVGNTALALASFQGHTDVMAYLMQEGANAGLKDTKGQSAWDRAKVRARKQQRKNGKRRTQGERGLAEAAAECYLCFLSLCFRTTRREQSWRA